MYRTVNGEKLPVGEYWSYNSYLITRITSVDAYYRVAHMAFTPDCSAFLTYVGEFWTLADALQGAKHHEQTATVVATQCQDICCKR